MSDVQIVGSGAALNRAPVMAETAAHQIALIGRKRFHWPRVLIHSLAISIVRIGRAIGHPIAGPSAGQTD